VEGGLGESLAHTSPKTLAQQTRTTAPPPSEGGAVSPFEKTPQGVLACKGFKNKGKACWDLTIACPLDFAELVREIAQGRPVYIRVMYGPLDGHAVVLDGYGWDEKKQAWVVRMMDPGDWREPSYRKYPYSEYVRGSKIWGTEHWWAASIYEIRR